MARLIWTDPALGDLGQIADYIALDGPATAKRLVQRVFQRVELLVDQAMIDQRSKVVDECSRIKDWEMDIVIGRAGGPLWWKSEQGF